jgi:hypothetical protein
VFADSSQVFVHVLEPPPDQTPSKSGLFLLTQPVPDPPIHHNAVFPSKKYLLHLVLQLLSTSEDSFRFADNMQRFSAL